MLSLKSRVAQSISDGLDRKTLRVPSIWAEKCRVMTLEPTTKYDFGRTPWCRDMINTDFEECVGQKAAQMGFTECMLNRSFYTLDQLRQSVLYVLPNSKPDASDFTQMRFNPAVDLSPHLQTMFSSTDNVGLKRAGEVSLLIRGSRSRSQLKGIPVGLVVADEVDEMSQEALAMMPARMLFQKRKQFWKISTPSIPGFGINVDFENSTKERFVFKCPHCTRYTHLIFPDCLVITAEDERDPNVRNSYYKCKECHHRLDLEEKSEAIQAGEWQNDHGQMNIRGFSVSQMYSTVLHARVLALGYLQGLNNVAKEQEFYNSLLGETRIVAGANLVPGDVEKCIGDMRKKQQASGLVTIGIDVGKKLHYQVKLWSRLENPNSNEVNDITFATVIDEGTIDNAKVGFPELDDIIKRFRPQAVVIDALPEGRSSDAFCSRFPGLAFKCFYNNSTKAKSISLNKDEAIVTVNRTSWMDITLGRFKQGTIKLPSDVSQEYKDHQTAPVRVYKQDLTGQDISHYVNTKPDHFAHAGVYSEVALKIAHESSGGTGTMESPLS